MNIQVYQTKLTSLDRDVTFRVMTPDGYETSSCRYPVLYMHDGQDLFYDEDAVNGHSLRYAQYYRQYSRYLPQIIIVGIDCPMNNAVRTKLYTPYTKHFEVPEGVNFESDIQGDGKAYLEWITGELKPWIDANYRTRPEGEYTALGGYSTGAIVSTYGVLCYPQYFSRLLEMSGAFYIWMDCLDKTLDSSNMDHVRYIYLDVSTREQGRYTTPEQYMAGTAIMNQRFISYGFDEDHLQYQVIEGMTHDQRAWRLRFPDAVRWVFRDL